MIVEKILFLKFSSTAEGYRLEFTYTLEYIEPHCYSYLSASTGLSPESHQAGYNTEMIQVQSIFLVETRVCAICRTVEAIDVMDAIQVIVLLSA